MSATSARDRRQEAQASPAAGRRLPARARLLTLTGPAGTGKTRLALEAAAALAACPGVRALVTRRAALHVAGEQEYLPPKT